MDASVFLNAFHRNEEGYPGSRADVATEAVAELQAVPNLVLVPLNDPLARKASETACQTGVRAADGVYTSTACPLRKPARDPGQGATGAGVRRRERTYRLRFSQEK